MLAILLFCILGDRKFYTKRLIANKNKIYGNKDIENKIVFGDKIVITAGENRTVLEYSSIKRIVKSGSIYALYLTRLSGTFFIKNSCADATDDELLSMLCERTGVKIKSKSKLAIAITTLATTAATIYAAICTYSIITSL